LCQTQVLLYRIFKKMQAVFIYPGEFLTFCHFPREMLF